MIDEPTQARAAGSGRELASLTRAWHFQRSDGSSVPFDQQRLAASIGSAFEAVAGAMEPARLARRVALVADLAIVNLARRLNGTQSVTALCVLDQVQLALFNSDETAVARAYGVTRADSAGAGADGRAGTRQAARP